MDHKISKKSKVTPRQYMHEVLHASDTDQHGHHAHKKWSQENEAEKIHDWGHWIRLLITSFILLSMLSVILETEPELEASFSDWFHVFEIVTVVIFSMEYVLRVWCIVEDREYRAQYSGLTLATLGRIKYILTPMALIDLIAIAPFFVPALIPLDLRFVRILRLIRLVRVMKLGHYSNSLNKISKVIKAKRSELAAALFVLAILLLFASTIMYYVEHEAQPIAFRSIPASFWWGIETLTTVGYGDVAPVTVLGKVCAAVIAVLGIGLFGLPTAIIATGFLEEVQHKHDRFICEECKNEFDSSGVKKMPKTLAAGGAIGKDIETALVD